jgi:hypothetical protein
MFPALEKGWTNALDEGWDTYNYNQGRSGLAPINSTTKNAFAQTRTLAGQGVPNLDQIYGVQSSILANGGMTQGMKDASGILGGYAANNGVTSDLARTAGYYENFANGSYNEDPRLQRQLDINADRAANAGATRFGGGRYGSAAIGAGIGNAVADANNGIMLQSNENARNRQLQATQGLDGLYQGAANRGASAAGAMASLASQGAQNMATWGSMTPALNDLRYDGASRVAWIGDFLQGRHQTAYDNRNGYGNLKNYTGILGGMGNQGATTVSKTPGPSAAQSILGGIGAGAKLGSSFGPGGTLAGGILGGGFGAFS